MHDYRKSHLNKGDDYDEIFSQRLRESLLWDLEKSVLVSLLNRHFVDAPPNHLDFACGTGRILRHLRPYVAQSVGVDVSSAMIAVANRQAQGSETILGDITREPLLHGRKFDLITAFRFFPNAEPELRREAIQALRPLLSDSGVVIFNNHLNDSSSVRRLQRIAKRRVGHTMSQTEVDQVCAWGSLCIEAEYGLGILPDFGDRKWWSRALVKLDRAVHTHRLPVQMCENRIFLAAPQSCHSS